MAEKAAEKIVDEVWQLREGTSQRPGTTRATPEPSQPVNKEPK